jgi:DNA-binding XRE family transcriptional regulator
MSKRKPLDKDQARERRNRLLETAASATLSLTEGVREMRAIAGMTQEEFAQHRGVSARVIKAIELGQGNPTVATLNRIGEFFGLEVAFVPVRSAALPSPEQLQAIKESIHDVFNRELSKMFKQPEFQRHFVERMNKELISAQSKPSNLPPLEQAPTSSDVLAQKQKKSRASKK